MRIEHIAVWVKDLEEMRHFYTEYFNAKSSELYHNKKTGFYSYFLSFEIGSRLEIMHKKDKIEHHTGSLGYAHLAMSVGKKEDVDMMTKKLQKDGYTILSGPRVTGDGYYEAVIEDPECNLIEITAD
ncbi:VOC family protein [Amphibacillus cookii]|uniref:VOC family protein n=1 Tax=Amphibacillus cookii TaxID=767787 RepID=UPI001957D7A1|nr:VOC family protein [Amphibacillus cookii]MBM7542276.1 lactoylglutathione lyase [Amphibacillus cookii]